MRFGEKECPYCAEVIKVKAIKCRHCGAYMDSNQSLILHRESINLSHNSPSKANQLSDNDREGFFNKTKADYFSILSIILISISILVLFKARIGSFPMKSSINGDLVVPNLEWLRFLLIEDIAAGKDFTNQSWRLISPIFVHYSSLQLGTNIFFIWELGNILESKKGIGFYYLFMIIIVACSNFIQYVLTGPHFGGFSALSFGIFGYLWVKSYTDKNFNGCLDSGKIFSCLLFFLAFWLVPDFILPMPNEANTVGIILGMMWGYLDPPKKQLI
jgi:membrane associated rhomboid family serine protease